MATKNNPSVIAMHLSGNVLSYDIMEKICAAVSVNINMIGPKV